MKSAALGTGNMGKPPKRGKVLVVGDVTLDWLEQTILRTEQKAPSTRRNYELYNPGFQSTPVWGGAALLRRLVESALRAREKNFSQPATARPAAFEVEAIELPEAGSPEAR